MVSAMGNIKVLYIGEDNKSYSLNEVSKAKLNL
jgi:hypothetical protein